jgi:hypothetical protein
MLNSGQYRPKGAGVEVSLILADSSLGLILSGMEAVRLCMKVIGRQTARTAVRWGRGTACLY